MSRSRKLRIIHPSDLNENAYDDNDVATCADGEYESFMRRITNACRQHGKLCVVDDRPGVPDFDVPGVKNCFPCYIYEVGDIRAQLWVPSPNDLYETLIVTVDDELVVMSERSQFYSGTWVMEFLKAAAAATKLARQKAQEEEEKYARQYAREHAGRRV